jgi:hypothetical protein
MPSFLCSELAVSEMRLTLLVFVRARRLIVDSVNGLMQAYSRRSGAWDCWRLTRWRKSTGPSYHGAMTKAPLGGEETVPILRIEAKAESSAACSLRRMALLWQWPLTARTGMT